MARLALLALVVGILPLGALSTQTAAADTVPPDPTLPASVSSDPLPTAQHNGVVWSQVVIGDIVFAGGQFTRARPAGAAVGTQEVVRSNLMAYNVTTGEMTSFAPALNGSVKSLAAFGSTLYVAGQFTSIDGATRYRAAAFNATTGTLLPFAPILNGTVYGIAANADAIYIGGTFTSANNTPRQGVAGYSLPSYSLLPDFAPVQAGGNTRQLVISPDGTKVAVGGNFTTMNGSSNPGYGLALLDATTGDNLPMPVNGLIRNGNIRAAILSMAGDGDSFYGAGYAYSKTQGNLEGAFRADWDGNLTWVEDCHGDTYSVYPAENDVYVAGHPHYCGNVAGYPQTDPDWTFYRALAFSKDVRGTVSKDPYGYYNYEGQPRPDLLNWFPDINAGSYTGQSQGPWSISGNADYIVYGGEFTRVNNTPQQGLVRFGRIAVATNTDGPRLNGENFLPSIQHFEQGLRISWPANYDRDNERLSYRLIKNGANTTPVHTATVDSTFWRRPYLSYLDKNVDVGTTYTYRLRVSDPLGNVVWGDEVAVTAGTGPSLSGYDEVALADGPTSYWTLNETSGTTAADIANGDDATRTSSVTPGVPGGIADDAGTAYRFPGSSSGRLTTTASAERGPQILSVEAWFNTTTSQGGKIIGWGNSMSGDSTIYDRHLYMGNSGRLYWGIYPNDRKVISSTASYRDGSWHHAVANVSPAGQFLYVDGQLVASDTTVNHYSAQVSDGYWRIGGDRLGSWQGAGASSYFAGDIDNVAVYPVALSAAQVQAHYQAGTALPNVPPTAEFTHTVTDLSVAFTDTSTDPDGTITDHLWDFGDGTTSTDTNPTHPYTAAGTYTVRLTVTDNDTATHFTEHDVTTTDPPPANVPPTAEFTHTVTDLSVAFTDTSTDPDGTITDHLWDFGDGTTSTDTNPTHPYTAAGTYTVRLTVTDNDTATHFTEHDVTTTDPPPANVPPTAEFTHTVTDLSVAFTDTSTDPDGTITDHLWDFGDGTTSTDTNPTHPYTAAGTYTVRLTVTDDDAATHCHRTRRHRHRPTPGQRAADRGVHPHRHRPERGVHRHLHRPRRHHHRPRLGLRRRHHQHRHQPHPHLHRRRHLHRPPHRHRQRRRHPLHRTRRHHHRPTPGQRAADRGVHPHRHRPERRVHRHLHRPRRHHHRPPLGLRRRHHQHRHQPHPHLHRRRHLHRPPHRHRQRRRHPLHRTRRHHHRPTPGQRAADRGVHPHRHRPERRVHRHLHRPRRHHHRPRLGLRRRHHQHRHQPHPHLHRRRHLHRPPHRHRRRRRHPLSPNTTSPPPTRPRPTCRRPRSSPTPSPT